MKPASRRAKGNNFELKVVKVILEHAPKNFSKRDCYRMPLSGGHPFAGKADIAMSPGFLKVFPFVVECKHQKSFFDGSLLRGRAVEESWLKQVSIAHADLALNTPTTIYPLLIMSGNATPAYAATIESALPERRPKIPYIVFWYGGVKWRSYELNSFVRWWFKATQ